MFKRNLNRKTSFACVYYYHITKAVVYDYKTTYKFSTE